MSRLIPRFSNTLSPDSENAGSGSISTSYAVGRIGVKVDANIREARICGFVGWNHGSISDSYAAVDLQSGSEKVEAYGFCGKRDGSQSGTGYLDRGNFTYRGASYAAKYHQDGDKAASVTYARLSGNDKENPYTVAGMEDAQYSPQRTAGETEQQYPFPTSVRGRNKDGKLVPVHYGRWPEPMPLGEMGVFYWEKLVDADDGVSNPTYHMSALAVDPVKETITRQSTLSEVHDDGRVVTDYGYGYYSAKDAQPVTFTAENIAYTQYVDWEDSGRAEIRYSYNNVKPKGEISLSVMDPDNLQRDDGSKAKEAAAEDALEKLLDKYTFHCWNSYHEGARAANDINPTHRQDRDTAGLCLFKDVSTSTGRSSALDPNSGTFTLEQSGVTVTFVINPQFAASMSVKEKSGDLECAGALMVNPGSTESNPYQVRCGTQLQEINWYDTVYTDVPIGYSAYPDATRFPYLSDDDNTRKYYWKQTHDMDWIAEGNTYTARDQDNEIRVYPGVFFSIAELRVTGNSLPGWFGGVYDGGNYTMRNFNVDINSENYNVNCMGLFGAVQNATLKNIVLFSETGDDVVTVRGRTDTTGNDAWYAGGVLAGLALNSTITNCSVAGYTIRDETTRTRYTPGWWDRWGQWNSTEFDMGGAIGGLVGMTNQALEKCTAAATIEILCEHEGIDQNETYLSIAPVRVGGLVGSTTGSVNKCYTGGEIKVTSQNASVYAGRLIGGVGMGPFGGEGEDAEVTVSNCYSYLTLPDASDVVKELYNIGGDGRYAYASSATVKELDSDYYYGSEVSDDDSIAVTYRQLMGNDPIGDNGEKIYDLLSGYHPVTAELEELSLGGRYSYAPKSWSELQGLDYPFPTILTQPQDPSKPEGEKYHVHYGGWLLSGIERANGAKPVELDMFACWTYGETLTLSEGVAAGGTWSAEVSDESVVTAGFDPNIGGKLIVKALKANDTPVTVRVKYTIKETVDGEERIKEEYSLPITVYVTDNLELRPSAVKMFPNDVVNVLLSVIGKDPADPNAGDEARPVLPAGGLTVIADGVKSLNGSLEAKLAEPAEGPSHTIELKSDGEFAGEAQVSVTYDYTYTYPEGSTLPEYPVAGKTEQIKVTLLTLPESGWSGSEDGTTDVWTMDFSAYKPESDSDSGTEPGSFTANFADADNAPEGFTAEGKDWIVTLMKPAGAEFPEGGVSLTVNLTLEGLNHTLTVAVPAPETAEPGGETESAEPAEQAEGEQADQPDLESVVEMEPAEPVVPAVEEIEGLIQPAAEPPASPRRKRRAFRRRGRH